MSMWEIEGLTELAVRLVGESPLSKPEQRSFFANLYALHDVYDTSYTQFRCYESLIAAGFLHRLELHQVPGYGDRPEPKPGTWLRVDPEDRRGPVIGLFDAGLGPRPGGVFIDIRSPIWPTLRAEGFTPAVPTDFEVWTDVETFARTMLLAAKQRDQSVLSGYYGFAVQHFGFSAQAPDMKDPLLLAARDISWLSDAVRAPKDSWIEERFAMPPPPELLEELPEGAKDFVAWWSAPLLS